MRWAAKRSRKSFLERVSRTSEGKCHDFWQAGNSDCGISAAMTVSDTPALHKELEGRVLARTGKHVHNLKIDFASDEVTLSRPFESPPGAPRAMPRSLLIICSPTTNMKPNSFRLSMGSVCADAPRGSTMAGGALSLLSSRPIMRNSQPRSSCLYPNCPSRLPWRLLPGGSMIVIYGTALMTPSLMQSSHL
jgi:hypothetical protein